MSIEMPVDIAALRDGAVASAYGASFSQDDAWKLFDWLFYESDWLNFDRINCFVHLDRFFLADDDLREKLGLSDEVAVSDPMRLLYARSAMREFFESGGEVKGSTVVKLRDRLGRETYGCWLSENVGQGGEISDWYGCFASEEAFFEELKSSGWWNLDENIDELSPERLISAWRVRGK